MFKRSLTLHLGLFALSVVIYCGSASAQDEFHSSNSGDVFSSNSGTKKPNNTHFWDRLRRDYPTCTDPVNKHFEITVELYELAEKRRHTCCEASTQITREVNKLAKVRNDVWREIQACIRTFVRDKPKRRQPIDLAAQQSSSQQKPLHGNTQSTASSSSSGQLSPIDPIFGTSSSSSSGAPIQLGIQTTPEEQELREEESREEQVAGEKRCVFHYFYINGMNTPYQVLGADRGDYKEESKRVYDYLVTHMANKFPHERHYMMQETPNPSGFDPKRELDPVVLSGCLALAGAQDKWRCLNVGVSNCIREGYDSLTVNGQGYPGGAPVGDMIEVLRQGLHLFGQGLDYSAFNEPTHLVQNIAVQMQIANERATVNPNESHFFIVVAHSQGNFFAEAVPYYLSKLAPTLLPRVGIFAIGTPTDYRRVKKLISERRISTNTRRDDIIRTLEKPLNNAIDEINIFGARLDPNVVANQLGGALQQLGISTTPAPPNLPALKPKREPLLDTFRPGSPQASFSNAVQRCIAIDREQPLNEPPPADGLDIPLLDAHLITNYLNDHPPRGGTPVVA
ncbi:MAG: hypothetical protein KDD66_08235, partial [Bdellovibrionales bacterium]|nr:hypothetical protein [Bdellovibrionales bacterium]